MRFALCLLGVIVVTACAACGVTLLEGMPNTRVVVNQSGAKEVIYDLRGDWFCDAVGTVTIKQDGPAVEGIIKRYQGCCGCAIGHRWFKGTTWGNRVIGSRYTCISPRTENLVFYITEGGDGFMIQGLEIDRPTFYTFKRLK